MTEAQWALVLAALAAVGALVSAVMAVLAKRDSRTSAEAAQTSATAAQTSAAAAEDTVVEARRANDRNEAADRAVLNAEMRAGLSIQQNDLGRFRFVNAGGRPIQALRMIDPPACVVDGSQVFEVPIRGESADFGVTVNEDDWPAFLLVQWQGLSQPEPIDFPPRGPRVWFI